jgi:hypothetical protein
VEERLRDRRVRMKIDVWTHVLSRAYVEHLEV